MKVAYRDIENRDGNIWHWMAGRKRVEVNPTSREVLFKIKLK